MHQRFNNSGRMWLHMQVSYYPTKEESKRCWKKKSLPAVVIEIYQGRMVDLVVTCPNGPDFTVRWCHKRTEEGQERVWDFTEEYKNDYRGL